MGVGKSAPSLVTCLQERGKEEELVVKFAGGCEAGNGSLIREAVAAMMAADLDLPVPEPFLVMVEEKFVTEIPEWNDRYRQAKRNAGASIGWNFGSKKLPPGFTTILKGRRIPPVLKPTAAEILAFDVFIANFDRTVANPNCLSNGTEFAIFDHELAFHTKSILFWKPPWEKDAISFPKGQPDNIRHVFMEELRGSEPDLERLAGAFDVLTDARLSEYQKALPPEWIGDGSDIGGILEYVGSLRRNIDLAISNLKKALQ
jgi:hypothetical protein